MTNQGELQAARSKLEALLPEARIDVSADPYRGLRILAISEIFSGMKPGDRRQLILSAVDDAVVAKLDLLSPAEADLMLLGDVSATTNEQQRLPLWPESIIRGQMETITVSLPSESDEPLSTPIFVTFYSLRGGVGRSTALAHTAHVLSKSSRVLCVDMDLEAPGLAALFGAENEVELDTGVVPLLLEAEMSGSVPNVSPHVLRVDPQRELYLLPAGVPDANYARKLTQLDPSSWYQEGANPLHLLIQSIREMALKPQVVLIDSRTGISAMSAPLLFDVADLAVVTFFPHPQARLGTGMLTRALLGATTTRSSDTRQYTPELRFLVSPVPGANAPEIRNHYIDRANTWISEWLAPARKLDGGPVFDDIDELIHFVGYSEEIAASDRAVQGAAENIYAPVAGWVAGFVDPLTEDPAPSGIGEVDLRKDRVLNDLRFSTGTAEDQSEDDFNETFLKTDLVERALSIETPLILGRKGTGKTALFRRLASESPSVVVTSPPGLPTTSAWMPDSEVYAAISSELTSRQLEWRSFWPLLVGIAISLNQEDAEAPTWVSERLAFVGGNKSTYGSLELVRDLRVLFSDPDAPLLALDWLARLDRQRESPVFLLFDGLDTGFGLEENDIHRRREGIAGLLSFMGARATQYENLRFKVMLREDIWRDLSVPNKSHFYGREVRLAWANQVDYLRVVVKQALRSAEFENLVVEAIGRPGLDLRQTSVEYWPENAVYDAWILLVGERVAGGKTAFTYNWVWFRLSDANDDHSPRAALQLMHEAVILEKRLNRASSYNRSILRPRSIVASLDAVSEQAIEALREEFRELENLFDELTQVGRTPFSVDEISVPAGVETLAQEVGLLGVDVGSKDDVQRYRVPELYRKALGMSRRGQA